MEYQYQHTYSGEDGIAPRLLDLHSGHQEPDGESIATPTWADSHYGDIGHGNCGADVTDQSGGGLVEGTRIARLPGMTPNLDVMDIDIDIDLASWVSSWGPTTVDNDILNAGFTGSVQHFDALANAAGPTDFLFPEDEISNGRSLGIAPGEGITGPHSHFQSHAGVGVESDYGKGLEQNMLTNPDLTTLQLRMAGPSCELDLSDPEALDLYQQLKILSRTRSGATELVFEDCSSSKETMLHQLAMRFKLSYSYDSNTRKTSIKRPAQPIEYDPNLQSIKWVLPHRNDEVDTKMGDDVGYEVDTKLTQKLMVPLMVLEQGYGSISHISPRPKSSLSSPSARSIPESPLSDSLRHSLSLSAPWNLLHSGNSSRKPRGRRGPLTAKSRKEIKVLEGVGGACWRCRILRRKCDPGTPCKSCPAPHLLEDLPPWPLIGCRRGNLRDSIPPQVLCPKARSGHSGVACEPIPEVAERTGSQSPRPRSQPDPVAQCLREAEMQRLSDNKTVLENASVYLRLRGGSPAANHFAQAMQNGRFRDNQTLYEEFHIAGKTSTYAELMTHVAWELADNADTLAMLEIESVDAFLLLLETASMYEVEVGKSPMVILSLICLRYSFDVLRLYSNDLLTHDFHADCSHDRCEVSCLQDLSRNINAYIEELASVVFKKVNLRDRRWWLSVFYSLCIQSYVRRALLVVEKQLVFPTADDPSPELLNSTQYLHLITVLFTAVSFQYDPLTNRQLEGSVLDDATEQEAPVPELYYTSARNVCGSQLWSKEGIKTSYQFLTRLFNIGSLDFNTGNGGDVRDAAVVDIPHRHSFSAPSSRSTLPQRSLSLNVASKRPSTSIGSPIRSRPVSQVTSSTQDTAKSVYSSPNSSMASIGSSMYTEVTSPSFGPNSPRSSISHDKRWSMGSARGLARPATSAGSIPSLSPAPLLTTFPSETPGRVPLLPSQVRRPLPPVATPAGVNGQAHICSCCRKKPQTFETGEELKTHEGKKPFMCAFKDCGRRFSRMNEAERHINTIHYRPFSWYCARVQDPLLTFQTTTAESGSTIDTCGYCGREYRWDGERDIAQLMAHLESEHDYGQCNKNKKFFREDLFGQHLKTTHKAESGPWIKALENLCKAENKTV